MQYKESGVALLNTQSRYGKNNNTLASVFLFVYLSLSYILNFLMYIDFFKMHWFILEFQKESNQLELLVRQILSQIVGDKVKVIIWLLYLSVQPLFNCIFQMLFSL